MGHKSNNDVWACLKIIPSQLMLILDNFNGEIWWTLKIKFWDTKVLDRKRWQQKKTTFVDCFPWFMMFLWTLGFPVFHVWWLPVGISSFLFRGASRGFHDYDVPPAGPPLQKKTLKNDNLKPWKGDGRSWYDIPIGCRYSWYDRMRLFGLITQKW